MLKFWGKPKKASDTEPIAKSASTSLSSLESFFNLASGGFSSSDLSINDAYRKILPLQSAIKVIAQNIARSKVRLFDAQDNEIVGGTLYNLINSPSNWLNRYQLFYEITGWWLLYGEMAVLINSDESGKPVSLIPLDPSTVRSLEPNPQFLEDIERWMIQYRSGIHEEVSSRYLMFNKNFNPVSMIRGLSPIVSASNELNTYYQAARFSKAFLTNNAVPSHIVKLPENIPDKMFQTWKDTYLNEFSGKDGKAFKTFITKGDVKIDPIGTNAKDLMLKELMDLNKDSIMQLYGVPPVVANNFSKTRFDSAREELMTFYDNTLTPIIENICSFFQHQLIDEFDWYGDIRIDRTNKPSRFTKSLINRNVEINGNRSIRMVLDIEGTRIGEEIKQMQLDKAVRIKEELHFSTEEALNFVGLDIPGSEENAEVRKRVWAPSGLQDLSQRVNAPQTPPASPAAPEQAPEAPDEPEADAPAEEETERAEAGSEQERRLAKTVSRYRFELRKAFLKALSDGSMPTLRELDAINRSVLSDSGIGPKLSRAYYAQIHELSKSHEGDDLLTLVNRLFNSATKRDDRQIASLILNEQIGDINHGELA